jgi:hypothetical protein
MEGDVNNNIAINWNNIVGQEARSVDNADFGKVQGLFEPFIDIERGTIKINKEKFYIPESVIKRYTDEILFFDITEQQAKHSEHNKGNFCNSSPTIGIMGLIV